jgi:hypothetical protein
MVIRPLRLFLASSLASLVPALLDVALVVMDKPVKQQTFLTIAIIFLASWLIWMVGTVAWRASTIRNRRVPRIELAILGSGLAFLLTLAAVALIRYVAPLVFSDLHPSKSPTFPVGPCLWVGLVEIPFGWFGGWLVWRLGLSSPATEVNHGAIANSRDWRDVRRFRFGCAVLLMPVITALGTFVGLALVADPEADKSPGLWLMGFLWVFATSETLAIILSAGFLFTLLRLQERVTRGNCVFLGAAVALLLPGVCYWVSFGIGGIFGIEVMPASEIRSTGTVARVAMFFAMGSFIWFWASSAAGCCGRWA